MAPSQVVARSHVSCDYPNAKRKAIGFQVPNTCKPVAATVSLREVVVIRPAVITRKLSLATPGSARVVVVVDSAVITRTLLLAAPGSVRIVDRLPPLPPRANSLLCKQNCFSQIRVVPLRICA